MTTTTGAVLEHPIGANGRFRLRQMSGEITVRGVDGDTVRVREREGRSIIDAFRVEKGEGILSLSAPEKFGVDLLFFGIGHRSSPVLEVEVPRGADVVIEAASAEVEASGLAGITRIRTASGDVTVTAIGGILELDAVSGEVSISADAPLDLRLRTISGDCTIRAPELGRAVITTTSGDIRLDAVLTGRGPFEITTVSGDATIVGRSGIRIEAKTITGDLQSEQPYGRYTSPGRKQLIVGDGGTPFGFKSVSGDLRVVAPRDAMPAPDRPVAPDRPASPARPLAAMRPAAPDEAADDRAVVDDHAVARLEVLHALERGELSVEDAMARLAAIEEA